MSYFQRLVVLSHSWAKWAEWIWLGLLLALLIYELWTVISGYPSTPPLTRLTVRYSPWWVTMPVLTWLWIHFAARYWWK